MCRNINIINHATCYDLFDTYSCFECNDLIWNTIIVLACSINITSNLHIYVLEMENQYLEIKNLHFFFINISKYAVFSCKLY